MKQKKLVEGPLGFPLTEAQARAVDAILKGLPKECSYRRKDTTERVEMQEGERADVSVITTDAIDREREVVVPKGIRLDLFNLNPVVCWAHKYDELPIGSCKWVKRIERGLLAKTVYASRPDDWQGQWFPDAVYALTKQGILKGKSIGFLPTEIDQPTNEELQLNPSWKDARAVIRQCVLLEFSACGVPMNQEALVQSVKHYHPEIKRKLGIKSDPIQELIKAIESIQFDPDEIARRVQDY